MGYLGFAIYSDSGVKKFGSKFPNCVGDVTNPDYLYGQLHFGSEIECEGESIPMEVGGVYRVSLESTSLDGERLAIGPEKALINTGAVITRLTNGYFTTIQ
ncbi:hypothetical protein TorRG33x02_048320 [Trema orientale]|uniref:Aspartic peptidase n=1 Tax=Trema orientale TaxID=63057 RepID=A0A2P5FND6_TREOI|nr:hypothetical protein TorRG33x02_048320 [Trema orientale]